MRDDEDIPEYDLLDKRMCFDRSELEAEDRIREKV